MKQILHPNQVPIKVILLIILALIISISDLSAGDITFSLKFKIEVATEDWEQPVVAEINNLESYPVDGASFKFTVTDKLSLDVAYEWSTDIGTIEPKSSVIIKADNYWLPKVGMYNLRYELNSSNDINPSNDIISYDVEVTPNPGISFKINQMDFINPFQQENSNKGRIDFEIPPSETVQYMNMMFKLARAATDSTDSGESKWLVQNFPAPAFPDTQKISYWIDYEKLGIKNGTDLSYLRFDYKYSTTPVLEPFPSEKMYIMDLDKGYYNVGGDNLVEVEFETTYDLPLIDWGGGFKVKTYNYRGCTVPNIDLDSSKYNPRDMPGVVGDWNSCGPAAAINSLQWLENTHDKIPDTGTSIRDKINIFNKVSGRANEGGINTAGTIAGKLGFIDSLKLPIHVKWQGIPTRKDSIKSPIPAYNHVARNKNDSVGAYATFEWLASEMEKGEDVEIKFGWYDSLNVRDGGHWVVVSGVSDVTTARGIYVKDDEEQSKAGGMQQTYLNWVTNEAGRPRLVGFEGPNNRCWVESVVSESYDSTILFTTTSTKTVQTNDLFNLTVYENPSSKFNPVTIEFDIHQPGEVRIMIYEIAGRLVYAEEINYDTSGSKTVKWDGKENNGLFTGNGIYLVKVVSKNLSSTTKIIRQD